MFIWEEKTSKKTLLQRNEELVQEVYRLREENKLLKSMLRYDIATQLGLQPLYVSADKKVVMGGLDPLASTAPLPKGNMRVSKATSHDIDRVMSTPLIPRRKPLHNVFKPVTGPTAPKLAHSASMTLLPYLDQENRSPNVKNITKSPGKVTIDKPIKLESSAPAVQDSVVLSSSITQQQAICIDVVDVTSPPSPNTTITVVRTETLSSQQLERVLQYSYERLKMSPTSRQSTAPNTPTSTSTPPTQTPPSGSSIDTGLKSRRRVASVKSYSEPSLNSKIRKGHVFFPIDTPDKSKSSK